MPYSGEQELERELREWRENRNRARETLIAAHVAKSALQAIDRRTVRVNGQEVLVVNKAKRALALY